MSGFVGLDVVLLALLIGLLALARHSYVANTVESMRRAYDLTQLAFMALLAILLCSKLGGVVPGFAPYLVVELIALLLFGAIVHAIWTRRDALRRERSEAIFTALFGRRKRQV
jgi:hypothetical protein